VTLVAASLFAGAGGSSLGYRRAGFRVRYACEFDQHAADTYVANAEPGTVVDRRDVQEVTGAEILAATGPLDLLDASPPCQAFSMAGRRRMDDPRAELYHEATRILGEARPRAFAFENVEGMTRGVAVGHLRRAINEMKGHGYRVRRHVVDFSRLGVPQTRRRLIVIGFREETGIDPAVAFPTPAARATVVNDVLPHVPVFKPAPTMTKGGLDGRDGAWIDGLSRADLLALSTFPADFRIEGSMGDLKARLGNSVPPAATYAWGCRIRDALFELDQATAA
jgi:DNA-cytosine methyltransferase